MSKILPRRSFIAGAAMLTVTAAAGAFALLSRKPDTEVKVVPPEEGTATVPVPPGYEPLLEKDVDKIDMSEYKIDPSDFPEGTYIPPMYPLPKDRDDWDPQNYFDHGYDVTKGGEEH